MTNIIMGLFVTTYTDTKGRAETNKHKKCAKLLMFYYKRYKL